MSTDLSNRHRIRRSFGRIEAPIEVPNLLKIQLDSYERFLQKNTPPDQREEEGLQAVFSSVFPISDFSGSSTLEYVHYRLGESKYSVEECRIRGVTYAAPLRAALRLIVWEKDNVSEAKHIHDIKEQDIYLGDIPLMTPTGSFIINGTERVIVSQMHKSPGLFFSLDKTKVNTGGKNFYSARIIPQRGSWLDFEFDTKDILYVRIDRRRKFPATILLRALGYSTEQILQSFYQFEKIDLRKAHHTGDRGKQEFFKYVDPLVTVNQRAAHEIQDPQSGETLVKVGRKFTEKLVQRMKKAGIEQIKITREDAQGKYAARDIYGERGELLLACNSLIDEAILEKLLAHKVEIVEVLHIAAQTISPCLRDTLAIDQITSPDAALIELYKKLKPGDPPTLEAANTLITNFFFNPARYSLSKVGRLKLNKKLQLDYPLDQSTLTHEDILGSVRYLLLLKEGQGAIDDIDHLGNRRIRSVGELLENQFRIGLVHMERAIKERMSLQDTETMMLHDVVNAKPVAAAIHEFFSSSQLSQFMDQTNPLSEITHKRRLSALGPGGLTRERAGFDVRDVHSSHYGRICPIETPEGPNIGLIASLATHGRINRFGFIETPYCRVKEGKVTNEVRFFSAIEEDAVNIAQANAQLTAKKEFVAEFVSIRKGGEYGMVPKNDVHFIDVAPCQLVSVAASLIPFLEHDDANRALMGSNMQRQGVPLIRSEAPLVGTGVEYQTALDSGACVVAKRSGIVDSVDAGRLVIQADVDLSKEGSVVPANVDIYHLTKYRRSNQNTCINQRPLLTKGDRVSAGDIIADGSSCNNGELALGQNIMVAFMPWNGYNFEDSILVSEKLLHKDRFTSVHIDIFDMVARDMKLGKEEITRDIPNVGEEALAQLDDSGIVRVGNYVRPGDILVGKVTPKGESQLNPEEKLLRAIFGEKAGDVRDTSLRVNQGVEGVVIDVVVFNRGGVERDKRTVEIERELLETYKKDHEDELRIVRRNLLKMALPLIQNKKLTRKISAAKGEIFLASGTIITEENLGILPLKNWNSVKTDNAESNQQLEILVGNALSQMYLLENIYQDKCEKISKGDELPPGVIRMVKVYLATKRKLAVGDKMAGRHGNKGIVSKIQPVENMPFREDGTPIDIVLNPLGVPSRMNVGQVLETHLGWAAHELGEKVQKFVEKNHPVNKLRRFFKQIYNVPEVTKYLNRLGDEEFLEFAHKCRNGIHMATPVFDGATEDDIHTMMKLAELPKSGQIWLYDGLTGERFSQKVTVGYAYILKLHHLVDEKIHARSIGPYSLVTQQPLGGKAQFGGQRFGEMEVWALEAYGAAYTLQELLTVKSDDVQGRNRMYETIIKGIQHLDTGIPESFKVLISELKSLCLNIELLQNVETVSSENELEEEVL